MKQLVVLLSLCLAGTSAAVFAQRSPAAPKRLLLVTTTVGFRHAAVPLQERLIRDLAKPTGEFTVVSTTDSPDFPAAAYQAVVDQRNARIPLAEAKDNNMPPPPRPAGAGAPGGAAGGGRGGAGGGRGAGGGGRGGATDPNLVAVTKVLQQYLSAEALKNYDAVVFCSTTGELPLPDADAFFKWVADGHAFIGLHSATDTLHTSPEYIKMIGGEFAGHGAFHPSVPINNMDPASPITAGWGASIAIDEEFYLFKNYDPSQVHLLLAMSEQPYTKEAGVFPVSWTRNYGKGRVFYTSLGHRDDVLMPDATIGDAEFKVRYNQAPVALAVQKHILNGIRWALGLTK
jgi:type 1 glutamine amidotransferase